MERMDYPMLGVRCFRERLENGGEVWMLPRPARSRCLVFCAVNFGGEDTGLCWQGEDLPAPAGTADCLAARFQALVQEKAPALSAAERYLGPDLLGALLWVEPDAVSAGVRCALEAFLELGKPCPPKEWLPLLQPRREGEAPAPEAVGRCAQALFRPVNLALCVVGGGEPEQISALTRLLLPERREEPACPRNRAVLCGEEALRLRLVSELAEKLKGQPQPGGLTERQLAPVRRWAYGTRAMGLDDPVETGLELCRGTFLGYDYLTFGRVYPSIGPQEVEKTLRSLTLSHPQSQP